jgi:multimeric flavodoxin WrbA
VNFFVYNGSPRKKGNCYALEKEVLSALTERGHTFEVQHWDSKVLPCLNCNRCTKDRTGCQLKDTLFLSFSKSEQWDGIIILSPIYFFGLSAETKVFLDRLYSLDLTGKIVGLVLCSGSQFRYCGADLIEEQFERIDEYCGSTTVTPYNKVTFDEVTPVNEVDKLGLQNLLNRMEDSYAEAEDS